MRIGNILIRLQAINRLFNLERDSKEKSNKIEELATIGESLKLYLTDFEKKYKKKREETVEIILDKKRLKPHEIIRIHPMMRSLNCIREKGVNGRV